MTLYLHGGATVDISGSLTNTGQTLTVSGSGTLGSSRTLTGGTVTLTNGATMVWQGGTLDAEMTLFNCSAVWRNLSLTQDGLRIFSGYIFKILKKNRRPCA